MSEGIQTAIELRDRDAYRLSVLSSVVNLVPAVQQHISLGLFARSVGVSETRAVREWGEGQRLPRKEHEFRLRVLARLVFFLTEPDLPELPEAWLTTPNPELANQVPSSILGEAEVGEEASEDQIRLVFAAARTFLEQDEITN